MTTVTDAAARGATVLDQLDPGWFKQIDLDTFSASGVYNDAWYHTNGHEAVPYDDDEMIESWRQVGRWTEPDLWDDLDLAWRAEIGARL